ncbi:hypothetical protein [Anaerotruncus colihominis]|uniref:hypothetical protein n=1 Tax=Anaerotruncus colihominis TaxID=169435 RepID=UPI003511E8B4
MKKYVMLLAAFVLVACCTACVAQPANPSAPEASSMPSSSFAAPALESEEEQSKVIEVGGENLYDTFADLWFKANRIYDVDDFNFLESAGSCDLGIGPEFYEITNYDTVVPTVFSVKGIEQLEQATIGNATVTFIQKKDGKTYRMGPWKTGYAYQDELENIRLKEAADNRVTLEVQYRQSPGYAGAKENPDYVPEYAFVDFTVVKENGQWLVEDYIFPENRNTGTEEDSFQKSGES